MRRELNLGTHVNLGLIADAPDLAEDLAQAAGESIRGVAYRVELKPNGSLQWRAHTEDGDLIVTKEPETSWWRRFSAGFYGILPIESQL